MIVQCTQCGGSVELEAGKHFLTCSFCNSALYVDKARVVFHFVIRPTLSLEEAEGKLRRWMAGNETVKDLDVHASVRNQELVYFPMWRYVVRQTDGDREYSQPACSIAIADIKTLPLSGGNLQFFSPGQFAGLPLKEPDVLLESAIGWLGDSGVQRELIKEINLIHIPFYLLKYEFRGSLYQAVVDGASGKVLTSVFPTKDEIPFIGIAVVMLIAFFVIGLIPSSTLLRLILFVVSAIPFGIISYSIAQRY